MDVGRWVVVTAGGDGDGRLIRCKSNEYSTGDVSVQSHLEMDMCSMSMSREHGYCKSTRDV